MLIKGKTVEVEERLVNVLPAQFFWKPKIAFKNKVYSFKDI